MAFQKIKLTFVILILVYLCAWGLKQHILKDKGIHGEHSGVAPRIVRWAKNASYPIRPHDLSISTPPISRKTRINGRLNGSKDRWSIGDSEIFSRELGYAPITGNRLVQKNKIALSRHVLRNELAREDRHPAIQDVVRKMHGKKDAKAKLRRRRSKYTRGAWRDNATRLGKPAPAMGGNEGDFRSARSWGRAVAVNCLAPTLYLHLRVGGRAGRVEGFKLMGDMLSTCVAELKGRRALPFVHILGRSSRALSRAWAFLEWMYRQEGGDGLSPQMYLERVRQLNTMMNILKRMKGFLIRKSKSLRQNLSPCFQCLPVWLHYIDQLLTEPNVIDFLFHPKTSRDFSASSPFSDTPPPRSKSLDEPENHIRLNPAMAALLVKMAKLLNDQGRRVSGLNSSLYGLQRSIQPATHAQSESRFRSLLQYANNWVWQQNASNFIPKWHSFRQGLIHNLNDAIQTTKHWVHTVYERVVRGVKFLCDQLLSLHNLGLVGIKKWLTSQYNQFQIQLVRKIVENADISTDYDTTSDDVAQELDGQLKLNESTLDLGSNESQNVISSAVESTPGTVIPNASARNSVPNEAFGLFVVNKTIQFSTSGVAQDLTRQLQLNESTGISGEIHTPQSTMDLRANESQSVISSEVESRPETVIPNATARDSVPNVATDYSSIYPRITDPGDPILNKSDIPQNGILGELRNVSTFGELRNVSTFGELRNVSTFGELRNVSTFGELRNVSTFGELRNVSTFGELRNVSTFGGAATFNEAESKLSQDSRSHFHTKMKAIIKIWIRFLIVLRYVGEPVSHHSEVSTEKEPQKVDAINITLSDQTWRFTGDKNNQTLKFETLQRNGVKSDFKDDALTKLFTFLRQRGMSNITEARSRSKTLNTTSTVKHHRIISALHDDDGLVGLWISKTRQLSRFLTWLVLLPQKTLSFIRRVELANLKLRMAFFRRIIKTLIDLRQRGQADDKTESLRKAKQREAFRNQQMPKSAEKKDEKHAQFKVIWNFHIYKIEDSKVYKRTNDTTGRAQLNNISVGQIMERSPQNSSLRHVAISHHNTSSRHLERSPLFNNAKHGRTNPRSNTQNSRVDIDKQQKLLKRPAYVQLERKRRSSLATGDDDETLKKQRKKLHRIANNRRMDRLDDFLASEKFVEGSHQRNAPIVKSKWNRPSSHHFSKDDADALRSKLLNLISLVEVHNNGTGFPGLENVTKGTNHNDGLNLDNIDDSSQKSGDPSESVESNFEEPTDGMLSNALNGEPTEADFELLNNIKILTKKFLGKRKKKIGNDYHKHLSNFEDNIDTKYRRKRSEDRDEETAEDLSEIPESDQMKKTGPDDKVKESRQFLQKWASLRKQAQNLQTEVNSARDKYASASDELALLLKKGNTLHDKVGSASGTEGVHKSMLEENWKNVNKEFDKYKSDMAARERELLGEDKRVNAEKIDQTLLRLEDAVSEQGDPNERILGDTGVLPFNAKLDRLGPTLKNMKNEALLAGQIASDEVMLESEDAEDDFLKGSEAGDYSIVDFDYGPDAKFVDEEDSDIAEDAESLTGFDYEIDRHSDTQLEDVDNMLSKLIARRFRSKRSPGVPVLKGVEKTREAHVVKNALYHTVKKQTMPKMLEKYNNALAGALALRHFVKRRASPVEIKQALNSGDDESGDYEEQSDISDEIKDIEGGQILGETNELPADNSLDLIYRYNLSNPKLRAKANRLIDVAANKEAMSVDQKKRVRVNNKKVGKFKTASDLLGYDSSEVGIDAKKLNESVRHNNDMVAIPLGSDVDIENGIEEIRREKEFLTAEGERIDEDIPSDDELKPLDQIINESMKDFSDGDFGVARDDTWNQKTNLEIAQLKLIDAEEEKQKMELSASSETQRQREKFQHNSDLVELEAINKGLDSAYVNLDQATKDLHRPPPRPSGDDLVISLFAGDLNAKEEIDEINAEAPGGSETLLRKRRSNYIAKLDLAKDATIKPHHEANAATIEPHPGAKDAPIEPHPGVNDATTEPHPGAKDATIESHPGTNDATIEPHPGANGATIETNPGANGATIEPHPGANDATIEPHPGAKDATIELHPGANNATIEPHSGARKGEKLIGFKKSADPNVEYTGFAWSRIKRDANPTIDEDERAAATAEGSIDGDLDEEVEVDESVSTGIYDDDALYEDDDSVAEEWEMAKPSRKLKKPKKVANYAVEGIEGQLLDAKSVVRQLKEEEDVAGHVLPPSSLVSSEQDLMEFGRKPDMKDVFLNVGLVNPVGLVELSDDEVNQLDGPVLSSTDIEKAIDNPTALVSALEDIKDEIKSTKHSVLAQTLDISRLGSTGSEDLNSAGESAEEVFQQIRAADEMGGGVLGRKASVEGFDALDDARRTRLTQKLLDAQEERDSELMDGGGALGEALQDLDQYKVDKDMDELGPFITFKDVLKKKKAKILK